MIEARNLAKRFTIRKHREGALGAVRGLLDRGGTDVTAVNDVSFTINRGEMVGYIGPNGAGKSTTIKMLTGILVPSEGQATVAGFTPWESRKQLARTLGIAATALRIRAFRIREKLERCVQQCLNRHPAG